MKKRITSILVAVCMLACMVSIQLPAFAEAEVTESKVPLFLNGEEQKLPLMEQGGRTLIPLRAFGEMLNASVYWNDAGIIQVVMQDRLVVFQINVPTVTVQKIADGKANVVEGKVNIPLPNGVAPQLVNGDTTYLPLRAAAVPLLMENIDDINEINLTANIGKVKDQSKPKFVWDEEEEKIIVEYEAPSVNTTVEELVKNAETYRTQTYAVKGILEYTGAYWELHDLTTDAAIAIDDTSNILNGDFWKQQVKTADPAGRVVYMSGFTYDPAGDKVPADKPCLAVKRNVTGILPVVQKVTLNLPEEAKDKVKVQYKSAAATKDENGNVNGIKDEWVDIENGAKVPVGAILRAVAAGEGNDVSAWEITMTKKDGTLYGRLLANEENAKMPEADLTIDVVGYSVDVSALGDHVELIVDGVKDGAVKANSRIEIKPKGSCIFRALEVETVSGVEVQEVDGVYQMKNESLKVSGKAIPVELPEGLGWREPYVGDIISFSFLEDGKPMAKGKPLSAELYEGETLAKTVSVTTAYYYGFSASELTENTTKIKIVDPNAAEEEKPVEEKPAEEKPAEAPETEEEKNQENQNEGD